MKPELKEVMSMKEWLFFFGGSSHREKQTPSDADHLPQKSEARTDMEDLSHESLNHPV